MNYQVVVSKDLTGTLIIRINWKVKIFESYESLVEAFSFSFVLVFGFNVMRRIYLASTFSRGKKNGFF